MTIYSNFPGNGKGWWVLNILPHISVTKIESIGDVDVPKELEEEMHQGDVILVMGWLFWELYTIIKN